MTNSVDFSVAAETSTLNWAKARNHRMAISRRVRIAVSSVVENIVAPNWHSYVITLIRVGPRLLDSDNAIGALKPVRDEVANWLGIDDGDPRLDWHYHQRVELVRDETPRCKRTFRTWVEVSVTGGGRFSEGVGEGGGDGYPLEQHKNNPGINSAGNSGINSTANSGINSTANSGNPGPPQRLERERSRAPVREEQGVQPAAEFSLPPRPNGTAVRVALLSDVHGTRLRIAAHYSQQGHRWRTQGVALELGEIEALKKVLDQCSKRA